MGRSCCRSRTPSFADRVAAAPGLGLAQRGAGRGASCRKDIVKRGAPAAAPAPKEPLIKSSADCVAGKMRMDARRATKVVAWTTKPRSATTQTPNFSATRWDGAFRAVCVVARLAKGDDH